MFDPTAKIRETHHHVAAAANAIVKATEEGKGPVAIALSVSAEAAPVAVPSVAIPPLESALSASMQPVAAEPIARTSALSPKSALELERQQALWAVAYESYTQAKGSFDTEQRERDALEKVVSGVKEGLFRIIPEINYTPPEFLSPRAKSHSLASSEITSKSIEELATAIEELNVITQKITEATTKTREWIVTLQEQIAVYDAARAETGQTWVANVTAIKSGALHNRPATAPTNTVPFAAVATRGVPVAKDAAKEAFQSGARSASR